MKLKCSKCRREMDYSKKYEYCVCGGKLYDTDSAQDILKEVFGDNFGSIFGRKP